jgi:hypothetical protein
MQKTRHISIVLSLLLIAGCMVSAGAYETPESIVAAGKVYVANTSYDPGVFFSGDTGTVTFVVSNGNSEQGVVVSHATLSEVNHNFRVVDGISQNTAQIGPGKSQAFTFTVVADGPEGFYYPTFSLSFRDADNLFYRQMIQIDDTPLILTVVDKPDTYTQGKKKPVYMQVANPRKNLIKNVVLELSGDGAEFTPSRVFVGNIGPGEKVPVNFSVTPGKSAPLQLTLNYDNGDTPHTVSMELPVTFGSDKKAANPVMSNVLVKNDAGTWHVTGDVNNAGLETANTVMVTSLAPAVPQDPYKVYVVGALKPDDFGSFEVTFTADNLESIPIKLSYKDADGNVYDTVQDVKISSSGVKVQTAGNGPPIVPIAAGIAILLVFVGGWAYYLRRNKQ